MEIDPYKCLLTSASREHLKRQSELNDRFVGNVFLPAINRPSKGPTADASASSFKHLKVIEQCIMAENKREEQLAKCQNDKEKRYWSRKFQAQRNHERNLIQALMLGTTVDAELEIADVSGKDASAAVLLSRSPLHASVQRMTTGITAKVPSEDRVFHKAKITGGVPKTKPQIHKKFTLSDCQGSPNKVKPYIPRPKLLDPSPAQRKSLTLDHDQPSSKTLGGSPPHRGSRSATPLRVSPPKLKAAEPPVNLSSPLSKSPLKQNRLGPANTSNEYSSKKNHMKASTRVPGLPPSKVRFDTDETGNVEHMLSFEGPTSFLEAQQIAVAAFDEIKPHVLQDQGNCAGKEATSQSARDDFEGEQGKGTMSMRAKKSRPHSSPESRVKPHDANDTSISHSHSTTHVKPVEFLKIHGDQHLSHAEVDDAPRADKAHFQEQSEKSSIVQDVAEQESVDAGEEQWETYDEAAEDAISTPLDASNEDEIALHEHESPEPTEADAGPESSQGTADIEQDLQVEEVETEGLETSFQQSDDHLEPATSSHQESMVIAMSAEELDDQAETEVAKVLFDLVDQLAGDFPEDLDANAAQSPGADGSSASSSLSASIHIQSAFRGHQARRAFRMALYQEALSCGVLGAMPGSFQGKSGWYQDPKSLMAYYFTILPDTGEWKQKIVIRCNRLILTSYQMHEEILSKVFISP